MSGLVGSGQGPQLLLSIPEERERTQMQEVQKRPYNSRGVCKLWLVLLCRLFGNKTVLLFFPLPFFSMLASWFLFIQSTGK